MLKAGWHAHKLNAPGKFLVWSPEHDTPRRARAFLITDNDVTDAIARYAPARPQLDAISRLALTAAPPAPPVTAEPGDQGTGDAGTAQPDSAQDDGPESTLWTALSLAPDDGISVPELVAITRMGRRWVYYRLRELAAAGRVIQTARGQSRTVPGDGNRERPEHCARALLHARVCT